MKIYCPLKNSIITQGFGIEKTKPELIPLYNSIGLKAHNGFDYSAKDGQPIYFDVSCKGKVNYLSSDINLGYGIEILTQDKDGTFKHRYWHLKSMVVKVGQEVESGNLIGYADNTGKYTTGTHLHRDLKRCVIIKNGVIETLNKDNGYFGAIDITPFYYPVFVLDYIKLIEGQISFLQKIIDFWKEVFKLKNKEK